MARMTNRIGVIRKTKIERLGEGGRGRGGDWAIYGQVVGSNSMLRRMCWRTNQAVIPECLCREPRAGCGFPTEAFGNDGLGTLAQSKSRITFHDSRIICTNCSKK